jgi:hypothetical protein
MHSPIVSNHEENIWLRLSRVRSVTSQFTSTSDTQYEKWNQQRRCLACKSNKTSEEGLLVWNHNEPTEPTENKDLEKHASPRVLL